MKAIRDWSVRSKMILIILMIACGAMILFSTIFAIVEVQMMRKSVTDNLVVLAEAVAKNSIGAISFQDPESAKEVLNALIAESDVVHATIFTPDGNSFASYVKKGATPPEISLLKFSYGHRFGFENREAFLQVFHPIYFDDTLIGTLYVRSNLAKAQQQLVYYFLSLLLDFFLVLAVVFFASTRLQRLITKPILTLAATMQAVSDHGDYSVSVKATSADEIGRLVNNFNSMLRVIRDRDQQLMKHRDQLETTVEERTAELRKKRDEALASVKAKSEFLANMSHEIRTPMNGVLGMLSLLERAELSKEHRDFLNTATSSANGLLKIINDILDFSKIDAGKLEFEMIDFDLRDLVEDTTALFARSSEEKKVDLACFVPTFVHCAVKGDPTRLRQLLNNMISNALKFTETGEVSVSISTIETLKDRHIFRFSVKDTGIGLDENDIDNLFESFTQADGSTTRKFGGTGLGLSVCKKLVHLMGGEIGAQNNPQGRGAEFWITLPLLLGNAVVKSDHTVAEKYNEVKILIIDDNPTNCEILEHYLLAEGITPTISHSPFEGLAKLYEAHCKHQPFDILLLDYHMPGKDGLQLARQLSQETEIVPPHIIMLSSGGVTQSEAQEAKIDAHLLKPFRRSQLFELLNHYLHQTSSKENISQAGNNAISEFDSVRFQGSVLVVDDEPINQKVAINLLKYFGLDADCTDNGPDAIKMSSDKAYDAILMDCQMPEMSGFETTRVIRDRETGEGLPRTIIVALTANVMQGIREECAAAGMDDYLSKPINASLLSEMLLRWMEPVTHSVEEKIHSDDHNKSTTLLENTQSDADAKKGSIAPRLEDYWDREAMVARFEVAPNMLEEMTELLIEYHPDFIQRIEQAIDDKNAKELGESAHKLKGALSHFCVDAVIDLLRELETKADRNDFSNLRLIFEQLELMTRLLIDRLTSEIAV